MGPGGFSPTNPDLADILGDTDFDFENFILRICLDPRFPEFQIPGSWNQVPSYGLLLLGGGGVGGTSQRHSRTTEFRRGDPRN